MKQSTKSWFQHAAEDLEAMRAMQTNPALAGMVAFHAQQCLEKCFKGVLEEVDGITPRIHDLVRLYKLVSEHISMDIDIDVLRELSDLYIDVRYPSDFGLLPSGRPSIDDSNRFIQYTEAVYSNLVHQISG